MLVLVSHGVQAVFNETDTAVGFLLLGIAMCRDRSFRRRLGPLIAFVSWSSSFH
jgi:hypothetical protein